MRSIVLLSSLLVGCYASHAGATPGRSPDAGSGRDSGAPGRDAGTPPARRDGGEPDDGSVTPRPPSRDVDLLFVVDNSTNMRDRQDQLAAGLPRLVATLVTGDFNGDGDLDDPEDFRPVRSLHAAAVTTDMGTAGAPWVTCDEPDFGDDGRIDRGAARCSGSGDFARWGAGEDTANFLDEVSCLITQGAEGCGFEQPLEAALKAVSPAVAGPEQLAGYAPPSFYLGTAGHADSLHREFFRPDALLVLVVMSNEDDCSAADPGVYDSTDVSLPNLRCFQRADGLHDVSRYVEGLASARPPGRLVVGFITGVPADLTPVPGGEIDWEPLIGPSGIRDPRLEVRVDPATGTTLARTCRIPMAGGAFETDPPERLLQVARGLESRGVPVSVESICQDDIGRIAYPVIQALD